MKYVMLVCTLLILSMSGCVPTNTSNVAITDVKSNLEISNQEKRNLMLGKWYGKQPTKEGGIRQELIHRHNDGTYVIQFLVKDKDGSERLQVEAGHWGISGAIYFTVFRGWIDTSGQLSPSDPSDAYNYDAYHSIELTGEKFHYKHVMTGNEYMIIKVADDFEFKMQ